MKQTHLSALAARCLLSASALAAAEPPRALVGYGVRAEPDPAKAVAEMNKAFAEFKAANDQRLKDIEAKGAADTLTNEKVEKINSAMTEMQASIDEVNKRIQAARLGGGGGEDTPERQAYATAFNSFFRSGAGQDELKALAIKAQLTRQSDPDGGYVVTPEIDKAIDRVLSTTSAMRQLATVRPTGAATYKKRVGVGGAGAGWVGENEARSETATPQIYELEFPAHTLYANPEATEEMLEDADFDIAAWLADEVQITFAEQEGAVFVKGDGVKKPRGVFDYATVDDDSWSWGKLGFVISGGAAAIPNADCLIKLTTALKQGFRPNASWLMNRKTEGAVRLLKDGEDNYLWRPGLEAGKPATLLGYGVAVDDNVADVGAGAFPLAFGDFRRGYLIVDRRGVRVLRNPYKNEGFVTFYTTKRVGGGVSHFEAIKLLKIAAA